MEKAEFVVDTKDWKAFYRMSYDGNTDRLWNFGFLVDGTIHVKLGKLAPSLSDSAKKIAAESGLSDAVKELAKKIKKEAKRSGAPAKVAEMWLAREVMKELGLKTYPEQKELRKILKEI